MLNLDIYGTSLEIYHCTKISTTLLLRSALNPFDHVVEWIGKATGKLWWDGDEQSGLDADGILLNTESDVI